MSETPWLTFGPRRPTSYPRQLWFFVGSRLRISRDGADAVDAWPAARRLPSDRERVEAEVLGAIRSDGRLFVSPVTAL